MKQLAIFCSGGGSNAKAIIDYFHGHSEIRVALMVVNKPNIGAIRHAEAAGIPWVYFNRDQFYHQPQEVMAQLHSAGIDCLILAGFLWLVPEYLLNAYPDRVINIHPALLPKFGGKGMHGLNVHKAVKESGEVVTGITIHLCNKVYDEGKNLFQAEVSVNEQDSPEDIARKVLSLEHQHYAPVIERYLSESS